MANSRGNSVFTQKVTATTSNQKLDLLESRNEVTVIADADCFINFDQEVDVDERMLLKANTYFTLRGVQVRSMHYLTASASPNIYVMAIKRAHI